MNESGSDDELFEEILRRVARTEEAGAPPRIAAGVMLLDRFEVHAPIGRGGMGLVFSAYDRALETRVALKTLGRLTPRALVQLRREFRIASELVHPNLVRLHELFCVGAEWFFTMDFVEGLSVLELRDGGEPAFLVDVFRQLAVALHELHRAGTLHGDLKPSNFLITTEGRVVLLDFGLARPLGTQSLGRVFGTPPYAAPELEENTELTEAMDWYAFGVVLFEALTGTLPNAPDIERLLEASPPTLAPLCRQLLSQDPSARPQGEDILARLGQGSLPHPFMLPTMPVDEPKLFGRDRELDALRAAFERMTAGSPAAVFVNGPSGIGKTALIRRFTWEAERLGAIVIGGRCHERESMTYKAAGVVVEALIVLLDQLRGAELESLLPRNMAELTRVFPDLRALPAVADAGRGSPEIHDQGVARQHAVTALSELLRRLRERAPLVIWIDDLQWSDHESAVVLEPLFREPSPVPILFVGAYRTSTERPVPIVSSLFGGHPARRAVVTELTLQPLTLEDGASLARELLGAQNPSAERLRSIARDARGHPLFISELAHFAPNEINGECAPLSELITGRVVTLQPHVRELLDLVTVAGAPLARNIARHALDLRALDLEKVLDELRAKRLLRSDGLGAADPIDVHHDRIRDLVLERLDAAHRRELHRRLAHAFERQLEERPRVVAEHLSAAGEVEQASPHWILAGDRALSELAFEQAVECYERGLASPALDRVERAGVLTRRAEALAYAGQGFLAAQGFLEVAEYSDREESIEFQRRAAEQFLLSGYMSQGIQVLERVLRHLKLRGTRQGFRATLGFLLGRLGVRLRGLRFTPRAESAISKQLLMRVDAAFTVACSIGVVDFLRGVDYQALHVRLALEAGEPRRLLRALAVEVAFVGAKGPSSERRANELLGVMETLERSEDRTEALGRTRLGRGMAFYLQGRFRNSLEECELATEILQGGRGGVWELVTAQRFSIASLFYLGHFARLRRFVPPFLAEAEARGNLYATSYFRTTYSTTAWLVVDDVETAKYQLARARAEWTDQGFHLRDSWVLLGETHLDLYTGAADLAWSRLDAAWNTLRKALLLRIGVLGMHLWYLRGASALFASAAAHERGQKLRAAELLGHARQVARQLKRERVPIAVPLAHLVQAGIDRANGDLDAARENLGRAVEGFRSEDALLHAAAAEMRLGELIGGAEGAPWIARGRAALTAADVKDPNRMANLLACSFHNPSAHSHQSS